MTKKGKGDTPIKKGKRYREGGPAGKSPNDRPRRGTTPDGKLTWPPRRLRENAKNPPDKTGGSGPGKQRPSGRRRGGRGNPKR